MGEQQCSINTSLAVEAFSQAVAQGFVSPDKGPQPTPVTTSSSFVQVERDPQASPTSPTSPFPRNGLVCLATSGLAAMQAASALLGGAPEG